MIDIEFDERLTWIRALRNLPGKSYRITEAGFEAFVSDHSKYIYLGTYDSVEDAKEAAFDYRVKRLVNAVEEYNLYIDDSAVFMRNYLAFPNGMIFNIHGNRMRGCIDRNGYICGIFNNRNLQYHRIIATLFCHRSPGKDYVNHIDGDKQNNHADNLEWVTRSENTRHAFRIGLQTSTGSGTVYTKEELDYIRNHCFDYYKDVASYLGRSADSVKKYMYRYRKEYDNAEH